MQKRTLLHLLGWTTVGVIALGGTASALPGKQTVDSGDIKNGAVRAIDLATGAVTGTDVRDGSLTGKDVTLAGSCQTGLARSYVEVTLAGQLGTSYSCAGQTVTLQKLDTGSYRVLVPGDGSKVAAVTTGLTQANGTALKLANGTGWAVNMAKPDGSPVDAPFYLVTY